MSAVLVAVPLSLLSAVAYAVAAVAQERLAARPGAGSGLAGLLVSGPWWGAVGLNAGAALLHAVALAYGPLTLVQPLTAFTLVTAVPLGARLARRRVTRAEWYGTVLTLAGLGALLVAASGPAPGDSLSVREALGAAAAAAALVAFLAGPGVRPGLRHATASGVASGVASALTRTVAVAVAAGPGPLLGLRVVLVALLVAAFAVGGLLLAQISYRGGLGAPLAVVTLANPVAAAAIGLCLLGERLQGGLPGLFLASAGAVLAGRGVLVLSRSAAHASARPLPEPRPAPVRVAAPEPVVVPSAARGPGGAPRGAGRRPGRMRRKPPARV